MNNFFVKQKHIFTLSLSQFNHFIMIQVHNISIKKLVIAFIFLLLITPNIVSAQLFPAAAEIKEAVEMPEDSLGRRTPRGAISGYLDAVSNNNFKRASQYFNLTRAQKKDDQRQRLVSNLQNVLDNSGNLLPYSMLSNDFTGKTDDDLAPELDVFGTMTVDGELVRLYVENISKKEDPPLWLISSGTIDVISSLKKAKEMPLDRYLPNYFKDTVVGGVPIGHWLAIIIIIVLTYYIAKITFILLIWLLKLVWKKSATDPVLGVVTAFAVPFQIYFSVWMFIIFSQQIGISIIVRQKFSGITMIVGIVAFLLLLWRLTDFISGISRRRMNRHGRASAVSIILFLRRFIKIAIIVFGGILILSTIGYDVTAGLAALGIGGIALALGAQKSVENFVGSVTLIADQPIRIGDYCTAAGVTGTVEQIGMRSTRIRTPNRTVVTIPNGEFSSAKIENFAPRDKFLMKAIIGLRYETTPDQVRYLLTEIRQLLQRHEKVDQEAPRVRFINLGSSSLDLEVYTYILAANYDNYLEIQEELYLHIMDIISGSGTSFAFPSQTLYFAKDSGLTPGVGAEIDKQVETVTSNKVIVDQDDDDRPSGEITDSEGNEVTSSSKIKPKK